MLDFLAGYERFELIICEVLIPIQDWAAREGGHSARVEDGVEVADEVVGGVESNDWIAEGTASTIDTHVSPYIDDGTKSHG